LEGPGAPVRWLAPWGPTRWMVCRVSQASPPSSSPQPHTAPWASPPEVSCALERLIVTAWTRSKAREAAVCIPGTERQGSRRGHSYILLHTNGTWTGTTDRYRYRCRCRYRTGPVHVPVPGGSLFIYYNLLTRTDTPLIGVRSRCRMDRCYRHRYRCRYRSRHRSRDRHRYRSRTGTGTGGGPVPGPVPVPDWY
jgi:hypothetical protein